MWFILLCAQNPHAKAIVTLIQNNMQDNIHLNLIERLMMKKIF